MYCFKTKFFGLFLFFIWGDDAVGEADGGEDEPCVGNDDDNDDADTRILFQEEKQE